MIRKRTNLTHSNEGSVMNPLRNPVQPRYPMLTKLLIYTFIISILIMIPVASIEAASTETSYKRIYDDANLLSSSEYEELEEMSLEYGENAGVEIYILTHNDSSSTYPEKYIEDFEDQLPVGDRVYFLYDVFRGEIFMEGYGSAETYIHSKRIDAIMDQMVDNLRNGNYYDAFVTYIDMSASYMKDDSELNYDHNYSYDTPPESSYDYDNKYSYDDYDYNQYYNNNEVEAKDVFNNIWVQLGISLVIGGIVVGIMAVGSGGRMTAHGNNYIDAGHSGLIGRRDHYLRTTVTRVRRPKENTNNGGRGGFNAGGFRGGVSSGGRSHSSGGRKL